MYVRWWQKGFHCLNSLFWKAIMNMLYMNMLCYNEQLSEVSGSWNCKFLKKKHHSKPKWSWEAFIIVLKYIGVLLAELEDLLTKGLPVIKSFCKTMKTLVFLLDLSLLSFLSTSAFIHLRICLFTIQRQVD